MKKISWVYRQFDCTIIAAISGETEDDIRHFFSRNYGPGIALTDDVSTLKNPDFCIFHFAPKILDMRQDR